MSEPRRWLDGDPDAAPAARELLRHAARTPPIDARTLSISALLVAKLSATPAAAAALPLAVKLIASVSIVAVGGALAVQIALPRHAPHARPAARDRPATSAPRAAPPLAAAAPLRPTAAAPRPTPTRAEPAVEPVVDALALEVRWLDRARALLGTDAAAALRRADAHARRFPEGALAAERELIAVEALQRLGRTSEAQRRAGALLERFPGSMYRQRLRSLLVPR